MEFRDAFALAAINLMLALIGFIARITYVLGVAQPEPPIDPIELVRWTRRRRWLVASELAALPMIAALALLAAYSGWVDPVTAAAASLVGGGLGTAFLLHAIAYLLNRRLGLPQREGDA